MANNENIDRLIERLRKLDTDTVVDFNMGYFARAEGDGVLRFGHAKGDLHCGAVACIAGHAVAMEYGWNGKSFLPGVFNRGQEILGLSELMAHTLFTPKYVDASTEWYDDVTINDAIHALKIAKSNLVEEVRAHWRKVYRRIKKDKSNVSN